MKTVLVDATQLTYVVFYAERLEETDCFEELRARLVVGMLSRLMRYGWHIMSHKFVMCWDSPGSVRRKSYPAYKATRHAGDDDDRKEILQVLYRAANELRDVAFPGMGLVNQWRQHGLEADDLMAKGAQDLGGGTVIVTSDKDLYQCLSPTCWLFHPTAMYFTTDEEFSDKWGIDPEQWAIVKAIVGCPTDNVIGLAGVAEKTAARFIRGDLKPGHSKFQAIVADMDQARARLELVRLPHHTTKPVMYTPNTVTLQALKSVLECLGAEAYLDERTTKQWERLLAGWGDATSFKQVMKNRLRKGASRG